MWQEMLYISQSGRYLEGATKYKYERVDNKIKILANKHIRSLVVKMQIKSILFSTLNLAINEKEAYHLVLAKNVGERSDTLLVGLQIATNSLESHLISIKVKKYTFHLTQQFHL